MLTKQFSRLNKTVYFNLIVKVLKKVVLIACCFTENHQYVPFLFFKGNKVFFCLFLRKIYICEWHFNSKRIFMISTWLFLWFCKRPNNNGFLSKRLLTIKSKEIWNTFFFIWCHLDSTGYWIMLTNHQISYLCDSQGSRHLLEKHRFWLKWSWHDSQTIVKFCSLSIQCYR